MNAVHLAEAATLGSLMLDPDALVQLSAWLRGGDFADPWHALVYTTIGELAVARTGIGPAQVGAALIDRHGHRIGDLPRLIEVLQAVPPHPYPRHYGAFVLEASLRRQVATHAVLLEAAALASAIEGTGQVVDTVTAQVDDAVNAAEHRWAIATATGPSVAPVGLPAHAAVVLPSALGADRFLARHPAAAPVAVAGRERDLIGCLITRPDHLPTIAGWLHPDTVTDPTWRPVYSALLDLMATARPVDVVTVAAQVARASHLVGPGPDLRELREQVESAAILDPAHTARAVAGDQLRATATRTGDALRTDAANLGLDVGDLVTTVHLMTDTVRAAASHLDPRPHRTPVPEPEAASIEPAQLMLVGR